MGASVMSLARIQVLVLFSFVVNKFILRPYVLEQGYAMVFQVFVLSYSNFCEAIVGTFLLTYLGLVFRNKFASLQAKISKKQVYLLATFVAGIYVILQELKIHNLGGRNVYDPYDVAFSVIGLLVAYGLLLLIKPTVQ